MRVHKEGWERKRSYVRHKRNDFRIRMECLKITELRYSRRPAFLLWTTSSEAKCSEMPEFPWIVCRLLTLKTSTGLIVGISMLTIPPLSFKFMETLDTELPKLLGFICSYSILFYLSGISVIWDLIRQNKGSSWISLWILTHIKKWYGFHPQLSGKVIVFVFIQFLLYSCAIPVYNPQTPFLIILTMSAFKICNIILHTLASKKSTV